MVRLAMTRTYFLTVQEQRELRKKKERRPGDKVKRREKVDKIKKEPTRVLSARISKSTYKRLSDFVGDGPLSSFVEEAILCWIVFELYDSGKFQIFFSDHSYERNESMLKEYKRKKLKFGNKLSQYWQATIQLPQPRPPRKAFMQRFKKIKALVLAADQGVQAYSRWIGRTEGQFVVGQSFEETVDWTKSRTGKWKPVV